MTKITTITELMEYLEDNHDGAYGLRGASKTDMSHNYAEGDFMEKSLDLSDERDCDYSEDTELLKGTCAIGVSDLMFEKELSERYDNAKGYANCHHKTNTVYLVCGEYYEYGEDQGESILWNWEGGARIIATVEIA